MKGRTSQGVHPTPREAGPVGDLQDLSRFGMRLGLERIHRLLAELGHPERRLPPVYHIAGTNGKGSTACLVESLLRAAGYRTALFTSPHLIHYEERFVLNGRPVESDALAAVADQVLAAARRLVAAGAEQPTEFEVATAVFLALVARERPDAVVLEVGLGGRYDATNVVPQPAVSVVTNVALDHTEQLGRTVAEVAQEKAGIARPGVPLVTGATDPEALAVLRAACLRTGTPLVTVEPEPAAGPDAGGPQAVALGSRAAAGVDVAGGVPAAGRDGVGSGAGDPWAGGAAPVVARYALERLDRDGARWTYRSPWGQWSGLPLGLRGRHQVGNAAVAVTAVLVAAARGGPRVREDALRRGLATARWPGRLERIIWKQRELWLDGAHNPAGMAALARAVADLWPGRRLPVLFGMLDDKDVESTAAAIAPVTAWAVVTEPPATRTAPAERTAAALSAAGVWTEVERDPAAALHRILMKTQPGDPVIVTGSLYLVGHIRGLVAEPAVQPGP